MLKQILFTFVVFGLLCACTDKQETPEEVAKIYWNAILDGDAETANSLAVEVIDFELSQMIQPGNRSEIRFYEPDVRGDTATVATNLLWVDKDEEVTFDFDTRLVKVDGDWKINADLTQQAFFQSVYEFSLTDEAINREPQPAEQLEFSPRELDAMLEELEKTTEELRRQQQQGSRDLDEFINSLDENLQQEIQK